MDNRQLGALTYGVSNSLSALAMFGVVAKAVSLVAVPFVAGSSLQAYFLGTSLSVLLLFRYPHIAWLFTLCALACIFALMLLLPPPPVAPIKGAQGVVVFVVLALAFGCYFAGRSLRVKEVATHKMIPWIDVPYHTTSVLAILIVPRVPVSFGTLLLADCAFLCGAAVLDFYASKVLRQTTPAAQAAQDGITPPTGNAILLGAALILLTASIQGGVVSFVHQLPRFAPSMGITFSTDVLAASYMGAALGAFACAFLRAQISRGKVKYIATKWGVLIPTFVAVLTSAGFLGCALAGGSKGLVAVTIVMTVGSILSFQLIVIPLLHDIAALRPRTPFVQYCYCAMGVAVFLSMAVLQTVGSVLVLFTFVAFTSACSLILLRRS